jgi:hypothetical protein
MCDSSLLNVFFRGDIWRLTIFRALPGYRLVSVEGGDVELSVIEIERVIVVDVGQFYDLLLLLVIIEIGFR